MRAEAIKALKEKITKMKTLNLILCLLIKSTTKNCLSCLRAFIKPMSCDCESACR